MERAGDWLAGAAVEAFLEAARRVLTAHVYCVPLALSRRIDAASFVEAVEEILADPGLAGPLELAVLEEDPAVTGLLRCIYTPLGHPVGVSPMSEADARRRLVSMLLPSGRYVSFYRQTTPRAAALVDAFLNAFRPRPTLFAEVDPRFLNGWILDERVPPYPAEVQPFPQGYYDSAMVLATDSKLALLVNNGSD